MNKRKFIALAGLITVIVIGNLIFQQCKPANKKDNANTQEEIFANNNYVGDSKCQSCHQQEFADWKRSDHYMAMLPANDTTVLGDFNNVSFTADGVTDKFFKRDGKFFINTQGDDGAYHDFEVLYIFGYKPLQQYLIAFPGGRMQATRASWDTEKKKWFHQYGGEKLDPNDWLHWTRGGQNWNTMCAYCHSTNLQKNYMPETDSFHTTYNVINVSCEACHGPAEKHIKYVESKEYTAGEKIAGAYTVTLKDSSNLAQLNACGPCHARKSDLAQELLHTGEIMDNFIPEIPSKLYFHADGQINEEDYIYTSFLQSKMFRRNVKCSNCHNPHSGKIRFDGNQLCMQCHAPKYSTPAHTFHAEGSTGSTCVSCHMPGKVYMGNDYRHDHSFRVPRPDLSAQYNLPNACNNCHKDKNYQWAADAVTKWYGPKRAYNFAEDLIPGSQLDAQSEPHLTKLISDTAVPDIVKATAAFYLEHIPTQNSLNTLLACLKNNDPQVRYRALTSLSAFPSNQWMNEATPLLTDKVRAVRVGAANLFTNIPQGQMLDELKTTFVPAQKELLQYLYYQLDFPVGNLMLADYYRRTNDNANAEKYYWVALKKDSLFNNTRLNLASLLNAEHRNDDAMKVLKQAVAIEPNNEHIYYSLALLSSEMNDINGAMNYFKKAIDLKTPNPRVYYNYGLLLQQKGDKSGAEKILEQGVALSPQDVDLLYTLTYVYIQNENIPKAKEVGKKLKKLAPAAPEYQQIFKMLAI